MAEYVQFVADHIDLTRNIKKLQAGISKAK
jgi:hypothetical protein